MLLDPPLPEGSELMSLQVACRYRSRGYHIAAVLSSSRSSQFRQICLSLKQVIIQLELKIQLLDQSNLTETKAWS